MLNIKNNHKMKPKLIFLTCMLIAAFGFAQNQNATVRFELDETEVIPPKFCVIDKVIQGECFETIDDFLNKNIVYPPQSLRCNYQGTELVKFTVTQSGELTDFEVINSVCKKMDEEVINVLKLTSGKWRPACVNGKPVAMEQEVSVAFMLHPSNDFTNMAKSYIKKGNKLLFVKNNPEKALKYYDLGINLLPNNETLLAARGLCRYEIGDEEGAVRDWERLNTVARKNGAPMKTEQLAYNYTELRGYVKMMKTLSK